METAKTFGKWLSVNWERVLFVIVGLILLGTSIYLVYADKVTEAAVVFGLGFLSFIYANVARFKRFKGLGFEAELWEDKQKEAADLIERLREVVSIYTREVILGKVTAGRWGTQTDWGSHWKLYDDLVTQHNVLGQKIDFSSVKKVMDDYFLFDMSMPEITKVREAIRDGKAKAKQKIDEEFGSPIRDADGYGRKLAQYRNVPEPLGDPFQSSTCNDLAGNTLKIWVEAQQRLKRDFDVDAQVDPKVIKRLEALSKLYQSRPVKVTEELIAWGTGSTP
ncbi:hypothetical protein [Mesorhizobium sp. L48C026A00]|uniref:hypothetical protein n=1 Tax=Mesorhizobium sp. L48C026A00 TaxID=1287182 RepID=UPI0003D06980|nr:hypothetical protein [Mesorhizobium sp. L48C026A00]ESZ21281.1 hypothetical protein X737_07275 [Mesorhizobium sp. L48C026A00]